MVKAVNGEPVATRDASARQAVRSASRLSAFAVTHPRNDYELVKVQRTPIESCPSINAMSWLNLFNSDPVSVSVKSDSGALRRALESPEW